MPKAQTWIYKMCPSSKVIPLSVFLFSFEEFKFKEFNLKFKNLI